MFLGKCQILDLYDGRSALSTHLENLQWPELQDKALFYCFFILSINHKKSQYSHDTWMTARASGWSDSVSCYTVVDRGPC